jgi:hypothetical protein
MSSITEWLRGKFEDPQSREEKEAERLAYNFKLGLAVTQQRSEPVRKADKGWTSATKAKYFQDKVNDAQQGSPYTFHVTTKANCYQSALHCIEKGEPKREYAE